MNGKAPNRSEAPIFDTDEAAEFLRVSRRHVQALIASGELTSFRVGRARRIRRDDIDAYIAARLEGGRK